MHLLRLCELALTRMQSTPSPPSQFVIALSKRVPGRACTHYLPRHGYQNFAITNDAVIFFFDHDFLQEGPHKVSVPRTELAPLLD
jgi:hypothetical protein